MTGRAHSATGAYDRATACYEEAAGIAEPAHPELAAEALVDHALGSWPVGGPSHALPLADRARKLARPGGPRLPARADATWGYIALQRAADRLRGEPGTARSVG